MLANVEQPSRKSRPTEAWPIGANVVPGKGVRFRVWAPRCRRVAVLLEDKGTAIDLTAEKEGYFAGLVPRAEAGTRYRYLLDDDPKPYPDPASRFQSEGPHGPSQVVDPTAFRWTDDGWPGISLRGQVVYELHLGTFTREGTWAAAARELDELAALGITAIEVMPVADFPGTFGWGYDGVNLFAPTRLYGTPDDFRRFVDRAHGCGLGVLLDVVYNHIGPDGNYLKQFSPDYFTDRYQNEWGEAINFDGSGSEHVRDFFLANVACWIEEYHLDGLRFDATQQIFDASPEHILTAMSRRARAAAGGRSIILVAENESQDARLARPIERGGHGFDGVWNDDFHHCAQVCLTGRAEAYYSAYRGTPQELLAAVKWGFLYQGQYCPWQKNRRGTPALDLEPAQFVTFLQNHDQVSNSGQGLRLSALASPPLLRALETLLLLAPGTPMLFQGQEFAARAPFLYFADHKPELARLVAEGRKKFLRQFPSLAGGEVADLLADPADPETFRRCQLDFSDRQRHAGHYLMYRDLLKLRREEPAFRAQLTRQMDGAVLENALLLRFFALGGDDRLLVVNLGRDLDLGPAPEPLLAPPDGTTWALQWSSEEVRYGGNGTPEMDTEASWLVPGQAALVFRPGAPAN